MLQKFFALFILLFSFSFNAFGNDSYDYTNPLITEVQTKVVEYTVEINEEIIEALQKSYYISDGGNGYEHQKVKIELKHLPEKALKVLTYKFNGSSNNIFNQNQFEKRFNNQDLDIWVDWDVIPQFIEVDLSSRNRVRGSDRRIPTDFSPSEKFLLGMKITLTLLVKI